MLKIFGSICFLLGIGGFVYAASTMGSNAAHVVGPDWLYRTY